MQDVFLSHYSKKSDLVFEILSGLGADQLLSVLVFHFSDQGKAVWRGDSTSKLFYIISTNWKFVIIKDSTFYARKTESLGRIRPVASRKKEEEEEEEEEKKKKKKKKNLRVSTVMKYCPVIKYEPSRVKITSLRILLRL